MCTASLDTISGLDIVCLVTVAYKNRLCGSSCQVGAFLRTVLFKSHSDNVQFVLLLCLSNSRLLFLQLALCLCWTGDEQITKPFMQADCIADGEAKRAQRG